ncbi:MAG TPA: formate dehydrogenase accessory sulfurtransferase FdhD [Anoxybacillus sp.]|nr:formate dehydrogenase accessory sulfurtransferase FdhD [Anoxybacillus sp.]
MEKETMVRKTIFKYTNEGLMEEEDVIVSEYPLTMIVNGEEFATIVCSPDYLDELVIGFLASEGVIRFKDDVKQISIDESRGFAYVDLHVKQPISRQYFSKRFIGSCCGKSRQFYLHNDVKTAKTVMSNIKVSVKQCFHLMKTMQNGSITFQQTGGVHNAALCTANELIVTRSDIGRHNALDKIYGHCLLEKIPVRDKIIAFSGRVSSEVLLKVSKIGVGILLSKSAPTDLALKLAEDLNITVVGFIRGDKLNVYTHPERIVEVEES